MAKIPTTRREKFQKICDELGWCKSRKPSCDPASFGVVFSRFGECSSMLQPWTRFREVNQSSARFDLDMMRICVDLAHKASLKGEIPVGALIVRDGQILAQNHNRCEENHDPTAHAERLVLTEAGHVLNDWRLEACTLYVTLEPCLMCAGATVLSRIDRLVFGAFDTKAGACQSLYRITDDPRLNHRVQVNAAVMGDVCGTILTDFFRQKR